MSEVPEVLTCPLDQRAHRFLAGDVLPRDAGDAGVAAGFHRGAVLLPPVRLLRVERERSPVDVHAGDAAEVLADRPFVDRLAVGVEEHREMQRVLVVHRDEDLDGRFEGVAERARDEHRRREDHVGDADVPLRLGVLGRAADRGVAEAVGRILGLELRREVQREAQAMLPIGDVAAVEEPRVRGVDRAFRAPARSCCSGRT